MAYTLRLITVAVILIYVLPSDGLLLNNTVTDWGDAVLNQTRSLNISHQITARLLALTHLAQYKALAANADLNIADDKAVAGDAGSLVRQFERITAIACVRSHVVTTMTYTSISMPFDTDAHNFGLKDSMGLYSGICVLFLLSCSLCSAPRVIDFLP